MQLSVLTKLKSLYKRYKEIQTLLSNPETIKNQMRFRALSKEYAQLINISNRFSTWKKFQKIIKNIQEIMQNDPEMYEIAKEELKNVEKNSLEIEEQLKFLLVPKDLNDERNAFLEVRAGVGGNEAALFAGDLFRMYSRYAEARHWKVEILSVNEGELGGYKEIIARINGNGVYGRLKFESGGHRVQRIPATESQGRIHTSTCTVAVMPELPETEIPNINPLDLRIDTFRSSGAGGQHVNTTDSAIRITHIPTNIVVECQNERSQHQNKAKALLVLSARLYSAEIEKRQEAEALKRRNLIGSGERNDRNRTYNFPKGRVTDHRINLTIYQLDEILEGKLDILIEPFIKEHQSNLLKLLTE